MTAKSPIVLFDGVCNLCNSTVQFVIRKDTKKKFRFGSLQGIKGQEVLRRFNLPVNEFHSFILLEDDKMYSRSTAVLRMLKLLGGGWKFLYGFIIVPKFVRDAVYNWIARNRYKWYGKRDECMIPTPELRERFLD